MFRVARCPMIYKTESGWVGYRKKYLVAGRVRVPAGHCVLVTCCFSRRFSIPFQLPLLLLALITGIQKCQDGYFLEYQPPPLLTYVKKYKICILGHPRGVVQRRGRGKENVKRSIMLETKYLYVPYTINIFLSI